MKNEKWTRFYKLSPAGNTTLLLDSSQVELSLRAEVADRLMNPLSLGGEQVGFIDWPGAKTKKKVPSLAMMGGEFCANAVRAYATVLASQTGQNLPWRGQIATSGSDNLINAYVSRENDCLDVAIEIPIENNLTITSLAELNSNNSSDAESEHGALVRLPGITHIVLPLNPDYETNNSEIDKDLIRAAETWRRKLDLCDERAVGCIWYYFKKDVLSILPLVWVKATNSNCLETSCGSGALALALYLGELCGKKNCGSVQYTKPDGVLSPPYASYTNFYRIMQPSQQSLWVSYSNSQNAGKPTHGPSNAWLGGTCEIIARGETLIKGSTD